MEYILLGLFFIAAIFISARPNKKPYVPPASKHPDPEIFQHYQACDSLFVNPSEHALFHCLSRYALPGYYVLAKPRLEDIIRVNPDLTNGKLKFSLRARIKSRHVDFLLIDDQGRPRMAIELDGKSHSRRQAAAGDALKNGLFEACGLPLRRIVTGEDFNAHAAHIMQELSGDIFPPPRAQSSTRVFGAK